MKNRTGSPYGSIALAYVSERKNTYCNGAYNGYRHHLLEILNKHKVSHNSGHWYRQGTSSPGKEHTHAGTGSHSEIVELGLDALQVHSHD